MEVLFSQENKCSSIVNEEEFDVKEHRKGWPSLLALLRGSGGRDNRRDVLLQPRSMS